MGFSEAHAKRALNAAGPNVDAALNWCLENPETESESGPATAETTPKAAAETTPKTVAPATDNVAMDDDAELDSEMAAIIANIKDSETKNSASSSSKQGDKPAQKKTSEMTSEEKMQWLAERTELVRKNRELNGIQSEKDAHKSKVAANKAVTAATELKEKLAVEQANAAQKKKKKEQDAAKQHRKEIKEKIEAEKERRRIAHAREVEELKKSKEISGSQ